VDKLIIVAGNIGVGKSTLTALLSQALGWQPLYEAVDENPYLADFYRDMPPWSFHSQVFFLSRRLHQYQVITEMDGVVVQDRSVYEDAEIFAENLYRQGHMSDRDHHTYRGLYEAIATFLPHPDLVVYLRASVPTLMERIRRRGRDFERNVTADYLLQLNQLYEEWIDRFALGPVLTVPSDDFDFVRHNSHLELISAKIMEKLQGKETVAFD
jgi:deoxyadenosine/deoxycytidine kinase